MNQPASFSSSVNVADAVSASCIESDNHFVSNQTKAILHVSADAGGAVVPILHGCPSACRDSGTKVPPQAEVEAELDRAIAQLADAAVAADAQGDKTGARIYVRRMYAAIQSRTPEHQARLNYESLARIDADPCYFSAMAEQARQRIEQERGAA